MSLSITEQPVEIPPLGLAADLAIPEGATGIVLFAHGSGSSRFSPRNRYVAGVLHDAGFATLLLDLLTAAEEEVDMGTAHLRFDIPLLAERLIQTTDWVQRNPAIDTLPIGYFGASTGAAAALVAAAERAGVVRTVISRGGRPDLAGSALRYVQAPVLLIVGSNDETVMRRNRVALTQMHCEKLFAVVPGATHLFEEPGALEQVAAMARDWFREHLKRPRPLR